MKNKEMGNIPIPMCTVDKNGIIKSVNSSIQHVFDYAKVEGMSFYAITGVKPSLFDDKANEHLGKQSASSMHEQNGKIYQLRIEKTFYSNEDAFEVYFYDVTEQEKLKSAYAKEQICILKIIIDNYEEQLESLSPERRMMFSAEIDQRIRAWAGQFEAPINSTKNFSYIMYFRYEFLDAMKKEKFKILDMIRSIDFQTDFPPSLSIGVGVSGETLIQTQEYANAAIDLALGRGGDQAVVKKENTVEYFGGKLQAIEKSSKGKSRVLAHALKRLISQAENVFIVGHKYPDMDALGASLGMYRLCRSMYKDTYIVINDYNDAIAVAMSQIKKNQGYNIINGQSAEELVTKNSLVIVVDTSRTSFVDHPPLLKMVEKIVVVDHHRKSEDFIKNPALSYVETYASSASELVTEIIEYADISDSISKVETEALLAGITVDTNGFSVNTGVRTFEAAAWLRKQGADTTEVKRFFQSDIEVFKIKAKCIVEAQILDNGIALSICKDIHEDIQIINSQVADQLVNIKGVKASFVAGQTLQGKTVVSARSLGGVNVQAIMEMFGGGGHLNIAGAQVEITPEEIIEKIKKITENSQ